MCMRPFFRRQRESDSFQRRKRVLALSLLSLSVLFLVLVIGVPSGFASDIEKELTEDDYDSFMGLADVQNTYLKNLATIFETSGPSAGDGTAKESGERSENAGHETLMYSLMEEDKAIGLIGRKICMATGLILVIASSVIQLMMMVEREEAASETLMRIIATTVIGFIVVMYTYDVLTMMESLGTALFKGITKAMDEVARNANNSVLVPKTGGSMVSAETFDLEAGRAVVDLKDATFGSYIRRGLFGAVAMLALYGTFYSIVTAAYGLVFELVLRKVFAPIAFADFISGGFRSPGARFVRNYLGVYLRMAMFAVIVVLGYAAMQWGFSHREQAASMHMVLGRAGLVICVRFAMRALITASGQTAREIVGG